MFSNILKKKLDWQLISILLLAIVLRFLFLDMRPAHHDEGINGWFSDQMTANGFYKYDPTNYHGPLHFYIVFFFQTLFGRSNWILRLPTVLVSILSVYWILLFSRFIGRRASQVAAIAMAISPGFVYFGKFAIHEADLVFFLILILWGIMGLYYEGKTKYLWALAIGITGAILTKETYIIHFACFFLAWIVLIIWEKIIPSIDRRGMPWHASITKHDIALVLFVCIFLIVFFYSGNFLNFKGLSGLYETFSPWLKTGSASHGHEKPFLYWINLSTRYEQVAFIGLLCSIRYIFKSSRLLRYTAIYGCGTFLAYSLIPYKTPWCIISLLWPFYILFGDVYNQISKTRFNLIINLFCVILFAISLFISVRLNFFDYSNNKERYVYVHTFNSITKLTEPLFKLVKEDPIKYNITGIVIRPDEWPIPWILGDFTMIGYYNKEAPSIKGNEDFLVVGKKFVDYIEERLQGKYFTEYFTLRDSQEPSKIYFSYEKFKTIFPNRAPEFTPNNSRENIPGQGLIAVFYPNSNWSGKPELTKIVKEIDFYWEGEDRPFSPPFSVEFIGEIKIEPNTALVLSTDDGGYLEIDGTRVINDPGPHGVKSARSPVLKDSGWKKIIVGFYDAGGGAVVRMSKIKSDGTESSIPSHDLRYDERLKP